MHHLRLRPPRDARSLPGVRGVGRVEGRPPHRAWRTRDALRGTPAGEDAGTFGIRAPARGMAASGLRRDRGRRGARSPAGRSPPPRRSPQQRSGGGAMLDRATRASYAPSFVRWISTEHVSLEIVHDMKMLTEKGILDYLLAGSAASHPDI